MPFRVGSTPRRLKGKGIPQSFMDQFIHVFNSNYKKTHSDKSAYSQAYGVMNKSLYKGGYRKAKDGVWHKTEAAEAVGIPAYEAVLGGQIILEEGVLAADALREGLRFEGVALIDHAVSQLGTGYERYYSPEFNDLCKERTMSSIELGGLVTMYNKHGSAYGGLLTGATKNPIGKIEGLRREEGEIRYQAFISPTQEGKDTIQLILDGVVGHTSVRMCEVTSAMHDLVQDDGEGGENYGVIEVMEAARIMGIDLCDQPGIVGAGIVKVMESFTVPEYADIEGGSDVDIKWKELTIEQLTENRKDLLDGYTASAIEALQAQNTELAKKLEAAENAPADQAEAIAALKLDVAIEQAAQIGVGKVIAAELRKAGVSSPEEIATALAGIREKALQIVLSKQVTGPTSVKGEADPQPEVEDEEEEDGDGTVNEEELTPDQVRMMELAT